MARSYPRKSVAAHSTGEAHGTRVRGARGEGAPPRKGTGWIRDLRVLAFGARGGVARGRQGAGGFPVPSIRSISPVRYRGRSGTTADL